MAWESPPTFVDGQTLTATQLNKLSNAVNYLNALGGAPSMGFLQTIVTGTNISTWYSVWHRNRYLHVYCAINSGNKPSNVSVYYNGGSSLGGLPAGNGPYHLVFDLNSLGLTVGTRYNLEIRISTGATDKFAIQYIAEMTASS